MVERKNGKKIAILGFGKGCSEKNLEFAFTMGKELSQKGYCICVGGIGGVFDEAVRGSNSVNGNSIAILSERRPSKSIKAKVERESKSIDSKRSMIADTADGAIIIGGWYGSLDLVIKFASRKKPIIGIKNTGGVADTYSGKYLIEPNEGYIHSVKTVAEAISLLSKVIQKSQ